MLASMRITEDITECQPHAAFASLSALWPLGKGQLRSLNLAEGEQLTVQTIRGECWVTQEGDANDHVLIADDHRTFCGPGLLVVEALSEDTLVRINQGTDL